MQITVTISDPRLAAGLQKQFAAYNAGQVPADVLTIEQFAAAMLPLKDWADRWAPASIPSGEWLQRWTADERKAARGLGVQSAQVQAWLDDLDAHVDVNLTHQEVIDGVHAVTAILEQQGVIAAGQAAVRAAAILAF
jgi:hypothetical protein